MRGSILPSTLDATVLTLLTSSPNATSHRHDILDCLTYIHRVNILRFSQGHHPSVSLPDSSYDGAKDAWCHRVTRQEFFRRGLGKVALFIARNAGSDGALSRGKERKHATNRATRPIRDPDEAYVRAIHNMRKEKDPHVD